MIIRDAIRDAVRRLVAAGVEDARQDTWLLMGHVRKQGRAALMADAFMMLPPSELQRFRSLVERRVRREPVAQIIGIKEFWSLDFNIDSHVLCPRPDTECLIEAVLHERASLEKVRPTGRRMLDLGTGSGCLLIVLLKEWPDAFGLGVDVSGRALAVAKANAEKHGVADRAAWLCANWGRALDTQFDLIVSNPPYIAMRDAADLAPEVRDHEPKRALFAGADGLDAYRTMADDVSRLLAPGGLACLEIGMGQADAVATLFENAGLTLIVRRRDLAGIERCLVLTRT